jgi:hypothetical protein
MYIHNSFFHLELRDDRFVKFRNSRVYRPESKECHLFL